MKFNQQIILIRENCNNEIKEMEELKKERLTAHPLIIEDPIVLALDNTANKLLQNSTALLEENRGSNIAQLGLLLHLVGCTLKQSLFDPENKFKYKLKYFDLSKI